MHRISYTLLYPLGIPFFILLHLTFISSSLILRIYQALFLAPSSHSSSPSTSSSGAPKHVAVVLVPNSPSKRKFNGTSQSRRALVKSVVRVVQLGAERGIEEISIWDGQGLAQSCLPALLRALPSSPLPPSPPLSSPSSPTQDPASLSLSPSPPSTPSPIRLRRRHGHSLMSTNGDGSDSSETDPPLRSNSIRVGIQKRHQGGQGGSSGSVTSLSISVNVPRSGAGASTNTKQNKISSRSIILHLLPPSASSPLIGNIARDFSTSNKAMGDIKIKDVDKAVKEYLHFNNDPELLIVHHLYKMSWLTALLPRRAPELFGYPFWPLRITEIYQHPTPIPFIHHLLPILQRLRGSSLPFLRKLGYSLSLPPNQDSNSNSSEIGVIQIDEWEGAMRAWLGVEQRLGR